MYKSAISAINNDFLLFLPFNLFPYNYICSSATMRQHCQWTFCADMIIVSRDAHKTVESMDS